MIRYFKTIDLFRLISLLIILIIIRLPFLIYGSPLTIPELKWMLIGERLFHNNILYKHLWENISPLSAYFYELVHSLFGRSQLAYQIISIIIIFSQALIFNTILIQSRSFRENTLVPAFIYIILMNLFFDMNTISPALLSTTFVLMAIGSLFGHIENKSAEEKMFSIGLYLGIATLFFLPVILFILPIIFSTLLYTGTKLRKYFLLILGSILPASFFWLYYFWQNALDEFYLNMFQAFFILEHIDFVSIGAYSTIGFIPALFLLFSLFLIYNSSRYTSYQVRYLASAFFMLTMSFLILLAVPERSIFQLSIMVPFLTFFISHFFLLIDKKTLLKVFSSIFIIGILTINYISFFKLGREEVYFDYKKLLVRKTPFDHVVKGKKILVLGSDTNIYEKGTLATPYLNWQLARLKFDNLDYYDNLTRIFYQFERDMPEVIIDIEQDIPQLFELLPTIKEKYLQDGSKGVYFLKD